jgi:alpha-D-xyloside xylohydrolase
MKRNVMLFVIMLSVSIFSMGPLCAFEKVADGIVLTLKKEKTTDAGRIKIQVCTDEIIHVVAAPGKDFSTRPSLMTDKTSWPPVKWTVKEEHGEIVLSTARLSVHVNEKKGTVAFFDAAGNPILQEKSADGKIITPAEVMGENTFHIRQQFESPSDEAFYGLGAHQNAVMNYKDHDVDLWQYNIVDVVPFLVSSKNYGILWDNNSRTKFGDIRDFQPLSTFKLIDKDGKEGGLTAEYFKDTDFNSLFASRQESRIQHEFTDVNDEYPEGFQRNVQSCGSTAPASRRCGSTASSWWTTGGRTGCPGRICPS